MHFSSIDPEQAIGDDLVVVRYMKLSTFLLLTEGEIFIPSLKTLQQIDPIEGRTADRSVRINSGSNPGLTQRDAYDWLYSKGDRYDRDFIDIRIQQEADPTRRLHEIWMRELAIRRAIWCWYARRPESMAMWNTYGPHGIAIISTVGQVRAALHLPEDALTSVARINYVSSDGTDPRLVDPLWVNRPYYFKLDAYEHEHEVRFVIGCEPVEANFRGGILRRVDASALMNEVLISPYVQLDEAFAIKSVIRKAYNLISDEQIIISNLMYPGDPVLRMAVHELRQLGRTNLPDRLSNRHEEYGQEGNLQVLPKMMLEV